MDRRVTLPKRATSPTLGPLPPCKQTLRQLILEDGLYLRSCKRVHLFKLADYLTIIPRARTGPESIVAHEAFGFVGY